MGVLKTGRFADSESLRIPLLSTPLEYIRPDWGKFGASPRDQMRSLNCISPVAHGCLRATISLRADTRGTALLGQTPHLV
jgi:hypothetical protein